MKIIVLGATGMVGGGVLRECLAAPDVETVLSLGRQPLTVQNAKLQDVVTPDLFNLPVELGQGLRGFDACFFCLGVSSTGVDEAAYTHLTYDLTLAIAKILAAQNPGMVFEYISGAGTDVTSSTMWARVKGRTEQDLAKLPFARTYSLRPGVILPSKGEQSKVRSYRIFYTVAGPLLRIARSVLPGFILTTGVIGKAMLNLVRKSCPETILSSADIHRLAGPH